MQPRIPMPEIEQELQELIYSEMRQQVRLTEKQLPSIGSINLLNSSRQVNCVALSETGNLLTIGLSDSSVKVFWLSKASLMRSLGMGECNPFLEQEPTQVLN